MCANATVPLDYCRLGGSRETIDVAVIKLSALTPKRKIGTLFINFGRETRIRQKITLHAGLAS